ncbi:MAG: NAD(P)/FAD-dependent oxidoreductase [Treponema sp.]|nr:NAD(P)/FAD-dependent oxidoreductase [Treponema sp.]
MEKYDVIVVGAGNGGLSAAVTASQRGLKTILFEKHNLPGGAVSSFRRGRFEFEPSLHEMCEVGSEEKPGVSRQLLKDLDADVEMVHENSCYTIISTDPKEAFNIKLPCGIDEFCQTVEKEVPGSGEKVKLFLEYEKRAMDEAERLDKKKFSLKDLPEIFNLFKMLSFSTDFIFDMFKIPKKAQHIIEPYWTYVGEPTSTMCPFMMGIMDYCYVVDGAGLPSKFSHEISLSLDKAIRKHGGKIFYNTPVTKILIKKRKVYGVVAGGKEYYADNIICNCFPNDVFGHMVDHKEIPLIETKKANARKLGVSFINVNLGLNKSVQELGITDYSTFILKYADSTEQWKACHNIAGGGFLIANALNTVIPECSPEGTSHITLTTAVYGDDWKNVEPKDYKKTKLKIAQEMIDYYEKSTGIQISPYIEEIEVATPVTYCRYLGTPNGTPYGYQASNWDGIFLRTMNLLKERTIKGLKFVGAHAQHSDGYNQTLKSGKIAVEEIK